MLPTGKVAFWGRPPLIGGKRENRWRVLALGPGRPAGSRATTRRWSTSTATAIAETPAPLFCSGQSLLADGQLFVAGGNLGNPAYCGGSTPNWRGLDRAYTFDPWTLSLAASSRARATGAGTRRRSSSPTGGSRSSPASTRSAHGTKNIEMEVFTPAAERGGVGTIDLPPGGQPRHRASTRTCSRCTDGTRVPRRARTRATPACSTRRELDSPLTRQRVDELRAARTSTASAATRSCGRRARPATRA